MSVQEGHNVPNKSYSREEMLALHANETAVLAIWPPPQPPSIASGCGAQRKRRPGAALMTVQLNCVPPASACGSTDTFPRTGKITQKK
jgi:hypothetical protein